MANRQTAREEMLATIKRALQPDATQGSVQVDDEPKAVSIPQLEAMARQIERRNADRRNELMHQFGNELVQLGAKFTVAESSAAACEVVEQLARTRQAKTAISWRAPLIDEMGLKPRLAGAGVRLIADEGASEADGFIDAAIHAEIGITAVDYALADTGTLVLLARTGQARSASLLPPVHVALVKPEQILAGLDDLFPLIRATDRAMNRELSSAVTFITGPSRTADIELTLVVGVHGPQELHVILLK